MFDERIMKKLTSECENELKSIGYQLPTINYKINNRAKTRLGQCKQKIKNVYYEINLSSNYMDEYIKMNRIDKIKNTIIHELLHTMPNCMNHGNEWQKHANIVNKKLGYNISRLATVENEVKKELIKKSKYQIECECGQTYFYNRKTKYMDRLETCSCHKCNSKNLKLIQNY